MLLDSDLNHVNSQKVTLGIQIRKKVGEGVMRVEVKVVFLLGMKTKQSVTTYCLFSATESKSMKT